MRTGEYVFTTRLKRKRREKLLLLHRSECKVWMWMAAPGERKRECQCCDDNKYYFSRRIGTITSEEVCTLTVNICVHIHHRSVHAAPHVYSVHIRHAALNIWINLDGRWWRCCCCWCIVGVTFPVDSTHITLAVCIRAIPFYLFIYWSIFIFRSLLSILFYFISRLPSLLSVSLPREETGRWRKNVCV